MKRYVGFSTSLFLCVGLVCGQVGCQSGWKISNPFASHPRASSAETPEELDALDDVDELTPPPENYTVGDASKSDRSESLAQKGKYEVEDKASDVEKIESETRAIAEKTDSYKSQESYQVADYSQSYQSDSASSTDYTNQTQTSPQSYSQADPAVSQPYSPTQQTYAQSNPASRQSYASTNQPTSQTFAQSNQAPLQTTGQDFAQTSANSGFQSYSAPGAGVDVATNDRFGTVQNGTSYESSGFGSDFPATDSSFPVAQNTNATPMGDYPDASFGAAPSSSRPVEVAMNPESSVVTGATPANSQPATYSTGATTDSDPYSDVYYAPQTTSSGAGFAPGSASGLY